MTASSGGSGGGGAAADEDRSPSAIDIAKGGEELLARLADVGNANNQLLEQLKAQANQVKLLEESGRQQQQLIQQFERRAGRESTDGATSEATKAEAAAEHSKAVERLTAEHAEREEALRSELSALRAELEDARASSSREKEELSQKLAKASEERDTTRRHLQELEKRFAVSAADLVDAPTKKEGLEMECDLMRSRFSKEVAGREAAERALTESRAQQNHLKASLERSVVEARQLRQKLAEASEQVAYREEVNADLKRQLHAQRAETEKMLHRERNKLEQITRLQPVLPNHFLVKALV